MSHLTLRRSETPTPSDSKLEQHPPKDIQDSPTIGRAASDNDNFNPEDVGQSTLITPSTLSNHKATLPSSPSSTSPLPFLSSNRPSTGLARNLRGAAPSPLQTSIAASKPPSSGNTSPATGIPDFPSPVPAVGPLAPSPLPSPSASSPKETQLSRFPHSNLAGTSFLEISPPATPVTVNPCPPLPTLPDDSRRQPSTAIRTKPVGSGAASRPNMASASSAAKGDTGKGPPRTSSIDSAISAISSRAPSQQSSQDASNDISNLVRAAGSPEAVIQYLLKEKQAQSQQNAQLWRLVDKQRAMIIGLNNDLDRALKDKEKYRKKLKEVIAIHDDHARLGASSSEPAMMSNDELKNSETTSYNGNGSSSNLHSDGAKRSPVNMNLAPYPITPPADRIPDERPSKVGELLDPTHAMPKPSEHALDRFDHEEDDRAAEVARNAVNKAHDLPIHVGLPPSRSLPSLPNQRPSVPQQQLPTVSIIEATPLIDQGVAQFPPPPAPPPRKPPPAPLLLTKGHSPTRDSSVEGVDSESDYDSLLDVDEVPVIEARGRRRTREDDDRQREVIAQQEAEGRSISKGKKGSQKGTPAPTDNQYPNLDISVSPRTKVTQPPMVRDNMPASLAGVLSGRDTQQSLHPAVMSPGLPSSPRPMAFPPPLSPRGMAPAMPLSPRAPRQPIPLPPNAPKFTPNPAEQGISTLEQPHHAVKQTREAGNPRRKEIYRGLVIDEYPDLLLPPNALPSISVKVASSRMKPSRASLLALTQLEEDPVFTLAVLSRSEGEELWRVEKDTSSLAKLDQRMKQCPSFTAKTPDRSLFSGHAPAKLDARRMVLEGYLDELLDTPLDLPTALELCKYLSTNALAPNVDDDALPDDGHGEVATQRRGPGGRPFKTGYLTKRGKNFGGWKARYFVLDGPNLKYYETPGGAHLGTIKLQNAQIGKQAQQNSDGSSGGGFNGDESDNQYRHAFLVLEPKKKDSSSHVKHVLCAESDRERDQWVDTLLRWIDYKEANDDETSQKSGQHGHGNQGHVTGAAAKKKMHGQGRFQEQRNDSQDALIGVSYDSAKQGDVPDGAPPRRRGTASPEAQEQHMPSMYTISAPRDPMLISDSASWGSKTNLLLPGPTTEEKKQRKRSFFGFGPKARSSSEDQETLYNSSGGSTPQPQAEFRGLVRQVFGAPLAEAVRYCGPVDVDVPVPSVIYRCIQYLDLKNAVLEEGIFRLSGSNVIIKQLRERFNQEGDVNLLTDETYYDIHAVASLLKLYLRELPSTILTRELHMHFVAVTEMTNHREKIKALSELVQRLPLANETLLKYLTSFLIKIINHSDMNKMTVRNVGIVFSPTLNIPAPVFALLLQNYQGIFGIEPEEYELPSMASVSDAESRVQGEPQIRRPSTAGAIESSPHHQRLVEQMRQRSTPTPPPNVSGSAYRPLGTPPPRQVYEPQYMSQQGPNAQMASRAAYDSGSNDLSNASGAPTFRHPTYDRPYFGHGSSAYEQDYNGNSNGMLDASFGNKSKRRESSMFMGSMLNQQTSNSRLREETKM